MGIFSTEIVLNEEKVQELLQNITEIKNNLDTARSSLFSSISMITNANGFDLVEQAGGLNLNVNIAENTDIECKSAIDDITKSINKKITQIKAYNDSEGFDRICIFADMKANNIKDSITTNIIDPIIDTGATIITGGISLAKNLLEGTGEALSNIKTLAINTGAYVLNGAISIASSIYDGIKTGFKSLQNLATNLFKSKQNSNSPSKTTSSSDDIEILEEDSSNILKTNLENENTSNKNIDTSKIKEGTRVANAVNQYQDEIANADYATVSENLFTTTTTTTINGQPVKLTHVIINDPSQLNGAPANGSYANGLEKASSAAKRLNSSILINGSHFDYSNGAEDLRGTNNIVIVNGEIKHDGYSGGNELLIDNSGRIFNAYGKSAQELVNSGVKYSYACHSTQVIENGDTSPSYREGNLYKRTVIGMTEPCEYYIVTDTTYGNSLSGTAEYLKSKGVTNAYSLDQGGSVSLVRNDTLINNPSDENGERAVGDFLYFTN